MVLTSPKYRFSVEWFKTYDRPQHLLRILGHLTDKPSRMIEVGCFEGESTIWFLENILTHAESSIYCIDTFQGSPEYFDPMGVDRTDIEARFDHNLSASGLFHKVKKDPGESKWRLIGLLDDPERLLDNVLYDAIYIDGSHVACDVLADAVLAFELLKPNGIMIFDDYDWPFAAPALHKPGMAIDAFVAVYAERLKVIHKAYQVAVEKIR